MATAKVKQFWTAFVSVLFALLASLGLASPATAAQQPALQQGEEPALAGGAAPAARPAVPVPAQRTARDWHTAQGRALPPTIKQRIRAEAHGSSPSVRHLRADAGEPDLFGWAGLAGPTGLTGTTTATRTAAPAGRTTQDEQTVRDEQAARTAEAAEAAQTAQAAHAA
ncbi:DUF6344 domain-containing protein [Streptomyces sp. NPDC053431]|uniref:DUF6344 domain-containing protein n=1 Tax=Streptomyces sp. NPDC053431 TaxID=3365703 RepID=UPI0037D952B9